MNRMVGTAVLIAGGVAARRMFGRSSNGGPDSAAQTEPRWRWVTINRPPEEVAPEGRLPDPMAELGDRIEVQTRPAPGDKGTELGARLRGSEPSGVRGAAARVSGNDPRQSVRAALRKSKQLLETGEVLLPDQPPTTKRRLTNRPLKMATRRARGEGRL